MKKFLLVFVAIGFGITSFAQQSYKFKIEPSHNSLNDVPAIGIEPVKEVSLVSSERISQKITPPADREVNIVTVVDIGTLANAYSYANGPKSAVWVEPNLNVVTSFHRLGGTLDPGGNSGDLGYDISYDGGETWALMNECFEAVNNAGGEYFIDASRYPNHGIYNPTGNVEDAYLAFFAPNLEGSNGDTWGGYSFGVDYLNDLPDTTGNYNTHSEHGDDIFHYVPDGYDINSQGNAFVTDINTDWTSGAFVYAGGLLVSKGTWIGEDNEFTYEEFILDFPEDSPWYTQVAFAPDGMTGYIAILSNNGETWAVDGMPSIYPLFWKTTDGGNTWDGPTAIQIDGPDGIGGVVNHLLSDEQIAGLYEEPLPARDEIPYTYTGEFDIAVTADGNLHIAGIVCAAGEAEDGISFFIADGMGAQLDMFSKDGGATFEVEEMGRIRRYDAAIGELTLHNRTQITLSPDATKVFVTWGDTDLEDEEDNSRPNIWARGFIPGNYMLTADANGEALPTNVTNFSAGMWQSYFFTAPKTAFEFTGNEYTIPFTYLNMDPADPLQPVQVEYIKDFKFTPADWTITSVNENIDENKNYLTVSQNYPNPASGETFVTITLQEAAKLSMVVYSLTGQQVFSKDYGFNTQGIHTFSLNTNELSSGVYFYTVSAGENKMTRKMIVE